VSVTADGRREVLGFGVGDSEDGAFWTQFLRSLKARGLAGTKLVVFPNSEALHRLAGCILIEIHDEWQIAERRYLSESSMALIDAESNDQISKEVVTPELVAS